MLRKILEMNYDNEGNNKKTQKIANALAKLLAMVDHPLS